MRLFVNLATLLASAAVLHAAADTGGRFVAESARELPLVKDVDVLVVGGTFSGAAAAVAAKEAGASVFLVAPRRALAEEVVLPRRLERSGDDEEVSETSIADIGISDASAEFTYSASLSPASAHPDDSSSVLSDGAWSDSWTQSVQYNGDVSWTITPGSGSGLVTSVCVIAFAGSDFGSGSLSLESSADGVAYTAVGGEFSRVDDYGGGSEAHDGFDLLRFVPSSPVSAASLRLTSTLGSGKTRQLIGEILVKAEGVALAHSSYTPLAYEKALDRKLLDAGVPFLTGSQACGMLYDGPGRVSGAVIANRSGRQAVRAKVVVDATEKGVLARKAAALRDVASGNESVFEMTVIAKSGLEWSLPEGYSVAEDRAVFGSVALSPDDLLGTGAEKTYAISAYTISKSFPLADGSWLSANAAIQEMRDACWTPSLVDWSEVPFYVTPDRIVGEASIGEWTSAVEVPLGAFRPYGVASLYVLGQAADIERPLVRMLSLPGVGERIGARVGAAAALEALARGDVGAVTTGSDAGASSAEIREPLNRPLGIGALADGVVESLGGSLPIIASADVAVVGLGTAGGPAAIAASGEGVDVVGLEWLHTMGGVTTDGRIGRYWYGNVRGFTKTGLDAGTKAKGWAYSQSKAEWMRSEARACRGTKTSADLIFGTTVEGVVVEGDDGSGHDVVTGVVVVLPDGTRGVVTASTVVDCTGNADITAAAGGATMFLDGTEFSMQGCGTTYQVLGSSYFNTDFGFLNASDAGDASNFGLRARLNAAVGRYKTGDPMTGARERRRIVGDVVVNERDVVRARTWTDTVMHGRSNFDMHGFSVSELLMYSDRPKSQTFTADLPYRAIIPASLEGVLATGLGISATRDAMPIIRMQPDVQNQGYAAGLAAAAASAAGGRVRAIDVKALQGKLVDLGNLDARVLTDVDGAVTDAALASAVSNLSTNTFEGLECVLERPVDALPLLRSAYSAAEDAGHRLACAIAMVLAGDNAHLEDVVAAAAEASWDDGRDFQGLGNFGRQTGPVDYLVYTMMRSGDRAAVESILAQLSDRLVSQSGGRAKLSHFRTLTLAIDGLGSRMAYVAMTNAIARSSSMTGWDVHSPTNVPAHDTNGGNNSVDDAERTRTLAELAVARTMSRVGDSRGTEILSAYLGDARTIYSSWASLALAMPNVVLGDGDLEADGVINVLSGMTRTYADGFAYDGRVTKVGGGTAVVRGGFSAASLDVAAGEMRFEMAAGDVVEGGEFKVRSGAGIAVAPVVETESTGMQLVEDGEFVPTVGLTGSADNRGANDKRSGDSYFNSNLTSWTFGSAVPCASAGDNKGSGITRGDSYFSTADHFSGMSDSYAAFLRIDPTKTPRVGPGAISRTFDVSSDGTEVTVQFRFAARYYQKTYPACLKVLVDGELAYHSPTNTTTLPWVDCSFTLTAGAGSHALAFVAVPAASDGVSEVLLDGVMIRQSRTSSGTVSSGLESVRLALENGAALELSDGVNARVGSFVVDGVERMGAITSERFPGVVTGLGCLHVVPPPYSVIIR